MNIRVGFGFDVHQLVEGRELWLGGIRFEHEKGLLGMSDADVLIHAICDALFGAASIGDLGTHFPETNTKYEGIASKVLLEEAVELLASKGYSIGNVDSTICAEQPKINPHVPAMKEVLSKIMNIDMDNISIKASTMEKLGFIGREEGITAYATVLIYK
ncbi:MAG: 2-C-methyl-D-erythritol 2,4-cyclodiphosphate synthase [Dysgonomonas sp.]|nr:2-C-methyl-D-erythritol 2,4-cyclodiphosphate synthase [Dysgonomonas sp.]